METKMPRQYSLVYFNFETFPEKYHQEYLKTFKKKHPYVFFGEIPNMPGHCVVIDHYTGEIFSGYHTEDFIEIPEEEV